MNKKLTIITLIFMLAFAQHAFASDNLLPLKVTPLDDGGNIQADTSFNYRFDLTTNSDCTGVILTQSNTVSTNRQGEGIFTLNISTLTGAPNYICEYKGGVLRNTHTPASLVLGKLVMYGDLNVTGDGVFGGNVTAMCYSLNGTVICDWSAISVSDIWVNESGDTMTGDLHVDADINTTGNITLDDKLKFTGTDSLILYSGDTVIRSGSSSSDDLSIRGGSGQYPFINMSGTNTIKIGTGIGLPIELYQANQLFSELRMTATNWVNMTSNNYDAFKWYADSIDTEDMITWSADNLTTGNYLNVDDVLFIQAGGNLTTTGNVSADCVAINGTIKCDWSEVGGASDTWWTLNTTQGAIVNESNQLTANQSWFDALYSGGTDTWWNLDNETIYNNSGKASVNMTTLNATMDARGPWTNTSTETTTRSGHPTNVSIPGNVSIGSGSSGIVILNNGTICFDGQTCSKYIVWNGTDMLIQG